MDLEPQALKALVTEYEDRILRTATQIRARRRVDVPVEDLFNTGVIGFLQAVKSYDPGNSKGAALWTFAEYRVRGAILNSLDDMRRLPRSVIDASMRLIETREPQVESREKAATYDLLNQITTRFALAANSDDSDSPESTLQQKETSSALWEAVDSLSERERVVIDEHFRQDVSFVEIATKLGIDKSGVSRLYHGARQKLKSRMEELSSRMEEPPADAEMDNRCVTAPLTSRLAPPGADFGGMDE